MSGPVQFDAKEALMATRSRTSFQKRQKEILRMERQREKAARRLERKRGGLKEPDTATDEFPSEGAGEAEHSPDETAGAE